MVVPNITPGGEPGLWTEEQFFSTMHTGVTPSGHELNQEFMPWQEVGRSSDDELKAIWLFLQSQPKLEQNTK
jgi:hypothetical protein